MKEVVLAAIAIRSETDIRKEHIVNSLETLSGDSIKIIDDFVSFLAYKEQRHEIFAEETLKARTEPSVICSSIEEAMSIVLNATED